MLASPKDIAIDRFHHEVADFVDPNKLKTLIHQKHLLETASPATVALGLVEHWMKIDWQT